MAHVPILAEGRSTWLELMLWDFRHRSYPYITKKGQAMYCQLNPREIRLYDFSLPEDCIPMLLDDLAPYADSKSFLQGRANLLAKGLRIAGGLNDFKYKPVPSRQIRKQWVNVIPIGWKRDKEDWEQPDQGELL